MFLRKNNKLYISKKAQHLVEFVLFLPFLAAILGLMTELSYAVSLNIRFNNALNTAVNTIIYDQDNQPASENILNKTSLIMRSEHAPYVNSIKINTVEVDNITVVLGEYEYKTVFTLINSFFPVIPDKFYFKSTVALNSSLLKNNTFHIKDAQLEEIFAANPNGFNIKEESP